MTTRKKPVEKKQDSTKENHYGIGLVGDCEVLRVFKSKCKLRGISIGKLLHQIISEWNEKN